MRPTKFDILAADLEGMISGGKFGDEGRLPSQSQIAKDFNVSRFCASKALDLLCRKGVVRKVPGEGMFTAAGKPRVQTKTPRMLIYLTDTEMRTYRTNYDNFGIETLHGIEEQCKKSMAYLIVRSVSPEEYPYLSALVRESNADGVIARKTIPERRMREIAALGIPAAYVDMPCHSAGIGCSMVNYHDAYITLAGRLEGAGVRGISFCYPGGSAYGVEFKEAVDAVRKRHTGIEILDMDFTPAGTAYDADRDMEMISSLLDKTLRKRPIPEVFVCSTDYIAEKLISALKTHGIEVPSNTQVIGGLGLTFSQSATPRISTMAVDAALLGSKAVELLMDMARGLPEKIERVPMTYVGRDSCVILPETATPSGMEECDVPHTA